MQPIATCIAWSVCVSVCLSVGPRYHDRIRCGPYLLLEEAPFGGKSKNAAGQMADNWFVTGITIHTAAHKIVKNLKYAKIGLAIGILD